MNQVRTTPQESSLSPDDKLIRIDLLKGVEKKLQEEKAELNEEEKEKYTNIENFYGLFFQILEIQKKPGYCKKTF